MTAYERGLALPVRVLPSKVSGWYDSARGKVRDVRDGSNYFVSGSHHFYRRGIQVGAASNTPIGTFSDGVVAIVLDLLHIIVMIGGTVMLLRVLF